MKIGKLTLTNLPLNKNIFVTDGSGGMSRFFMKPQQWEYPERVKEREHKKERGMER